MSRWFRHYAGMMRDEKLVAVAIKAKQPVERVLWVWGAILESAAEMDTEGAYSLDAAEAAYFLRADEGDICAVLDALTASGRLADGRVVNWGSRQFISDRSATRQAAYRDKKRAEKREGDDKGEQDDGRVTAASRHGDAPELLTETKTEKKEELYSESQYAAVTLEFGMIDDFEEVVAELVGWSFRLPNVHTKAQQRNAVYGALKGRKADRILKARFSETRINDPPPELRGVSGLNARLASRRARA